VALRLEHHLLDQAAILLLHVRPVGERATAMLHASDKVVAQLLELGQ
jgi:hypothetical protein